MPFIRFFKLATRLPAYGGVMTVRVEQAEEDAKKHSPSKAVREGTAKELAPEELSEFIVTVN